MLQHVSHARARPGVNHFASYLPILRLDGALSRVPRLASERQLRGSDSFRWMTLERGEKSAGRVIEKNSWTLHFLIKKCILSHPVGETGCPRPATSDCPASAMNRKPVSDGLRSPSAMATLT